MTFQGSHQRLVLARVELWVLPFSLGLQGHVFHVSLLVFHGLRDDGKECRETVRKVLQETLFLDIILHVRKDDKVPQPMLGLSHSLVSVLGHDSLLSLLQ